MSAIRLVQEKIEYFKTMNAAHKVVINGNETAQYALEGILAKLRCEISLEQYRPTWVKGLKIQAIKDYRQDSGVSLKEAKDALEYYFKDVKVEHPNASAVVHEVNLGDILRNAGMR
jgi:ribosomal protein L7/L12